MVKKMGKKTKRVFLSKKKLMFILSPFGQVMHLELSEYCFPHLNFINDASMLKLQCKST